MPPRYPACRELTWYSYRKLERRERNLGTRAHLVFLQEALDLHRVGSQPRGRRLQCVFRRNRIPFLFPFLNRLAGIQLTPAGSGSLLLWARDGQEGRDESAEAGEGDGLAQQQREGRYQIRLTGVGRGAS
jgi:hypothetical protein